MLRRLLAVPAVAVLALLVSGTAAGANLDRAPRAVAHTVATTPTAPASSDTTSRLPGTTLEAEARDDGTSPAPWLIGSAIAAAAAIAIGGSLLKRRAG